MLVAANLRPPVVSVAPLVDDIMGDLGFSSAAAGLLTTLPVLFFGFSAPIAPRIAARYGIERTIFGSLIFLILGMGLRFVPNITSLLLGSAVIGTAIGICNVVLPALIKRDFAHRSGLMTGLYSMTLSGGAAVAAALTIPIDDLDDGNWRLTLTSWTLLAVVALVVWVPQLTRVHRVAVTSTPTSLWRNRIAWAITIFMASQSIIFYTFSAWLPQYLIDHGRTAGEAGTTLAIGQVVALTASLLIPIVAGRFADQRAITLGVVAVCAAGFIGLVTVHVWTTLWVIMIMFGPGASISLVLLFMVLRSPSTVATGQVSGMAQSVGYVVAAIGPIAIGALHDVTGSWNLAMSVLGLALVPQALSTLLAAKNVTMKA
ncbi:CynX/NimT family MFS transporter [Gordonia sp. SL306]|uniref:CynX/NimT family MFS transporter n=1 Tax=Gordonia sp. SL306 TaxID=2995145 RepID=UPI0022704D29|nr:MFS transporter [Gordonia sp. SL306]WAC58005.1 MFS transporter [Gordonia sp. SL306]